MIEISANVVADAVAQALPDREAPIVIIGSGYAGYKLAEALRQRNSEREILLFTADDGANYSKPGLSNALARDKAADQLVSETVLEIEQRLDIRIHARCRVLSIDSDNHLLQTDLGPQPYSKLVLAQGAAPIRLPLAGNGADEVLSVNDLQDYRLFRQRLGQSRHVTIIGNGLIGCEFANDLAAYGVQVSVVGLTGWPMDRLLPQAIGEALQTELAGLGVQWHLNTTVQSVDKNSDGYRLTLADGSQLQTELVVSAVGLAPRLELAKAAGIECNRGILVNGGLRTSVADIHALGDCAEINGQLLPYLAPINVGVPALADCLLGRPTMAQYPLMPVVVKTPALPLVLLPPAPDQPGQWQVEATANGMRGLFVDDQQRIHGYALAGELTAERQQWTDAVAQGETRSVA
ncbi:FAD-dependent oxidoreductase [Marinobacterium arenosum]|uniref:FAD-dependent oxidoreductase n=1 Tax=Marinobacterium arenosum TaxID=2862496 RepID=UPI0021078B75|nr:FAD-dependent oxidoreductase [Marinobacterium arenosum]